MKQPIKHRTIAVQKSIETGERHPLSHFDSRKYIQHNPLLGDGFGALLAFLDSLPVGTSRVEPLRAFQDGDISFAHLEYDLESLGNVVGFEVHRWEDDRIVEHWDNLQPIAGATNPSGRTMVDGPTEPTDHDRTDDNKRLVAGYVREVLIIGGVDRLASYVDADSFREHNPVHGDGIDELRDTLSRRATNDAVRYLTLHRVLGEGSFCLAISEGLLADDRPAAFYDLYCLENDRIVEHWDVVQPIPPREQWQNDNGKF